MTLYYAPAQRLHRLCHSVHKPLEPLRLSHLLPHAHPHGQQPRPSDAEPKPGIDQAPREHNDKRPEPDPPRPSAYAPVREFLERDLGRHPEPKEEEGARDLGARGGATDHGEGAHLVHERGDGEGDERGCEGAVARGEEEGRCDECLL